MSEKLKYNYFSFFTFFRCSREFFPHRSSVFTRSNQKSIGAWNFVVILYLECVPIPLKYEREMVVEAKSFTFCRFVRQKKLNWFFSDKVD